MTVSMDINDPKKIFPIIPIEILKVSGTVIYFLTKDNRILSLDLSKVPINNKLKQHALSHIKSVYIDASGLCWSFPDNDIDVFIPSDALALYSRPVDSGKLSAILIKLYRNHRISKKFLSGNL